MTQNFIHRYNCVFWDFDGVIKDSLKVKTQSFIEIFSQFDEGLQKKIKEHHLNNAGISRFIKIPLYLEWANQLNDENEKKYLEEFKKITVQKVIDSPWTEGVIKILKGKRNYQKFYIVTGTPQEEIEYILSKLNIKEIFDEIFGSPSNKTTVVERIIKKTGLSNEEYLMIGDGITDYEASRNNEIDFLLVEHSDNLNKFKNFKGKRIRSF